MITTETAFVLGAGASVPFGFPTGAELRRHLCGNLHKDSSLFTLLRQCGQSEDLILNFRETFELSGIYSIDSFIAFRPAYQEIGELAIAAALIPLENATSLRAPSDNWYQMLWNEMLTNVATPQDFLLNRVSFVTFNYDRSLEQYLLSAISHTFDLDLDEAFHLLSQIPIQHVYGSLGNYGPDTSYRYGSQGGTQLTESILAARSSIKIVPAVRGPKDEQSANWLAKAQRVFVMGFGFDPTNCARIDLPGACSQAPRADNPRHVFASAFNLTSAETSRYERNSCAPGQGGLAWTKGDCLNLLRERRDHLK